MVYEGQFYSYNNSSQLSLWEIHNCIYRDPSAIPKFEEVNVFVRISPDDYSVILMEVGHSQVQPELGSFTFRIANAFVTVLFSKEQPNGTYSFVVEPNVPAQALRNKFHNLKRNTQLLKDAMGVAANE